MLLTSPISFPIAKLLDWALGGEHASLFRWVSYMQTCSGWWCACGLTCRTYRQDINKKCVRLGD